MMPLFENAAMSPVDTTRDKEDWLYSPSRRFQTYDPTTRVADSTPTLGHSNTVMGHDEGASNYWNREGHKHPPSHMRQYNQQLSSYHGLEQRAKSNQSGGGTPNYIHPSRALGSWRGYWDSSHPDFQEEYRKLWPKTIE